MHPWHVRAMFTPDLSRLEAFQAQGVTLKHSWRSWSGVRPDGVAVFGIMETDVQADDGGSRCLLWSREARARFGLLASEERLAHCRIAAWRGCAEGILVRSNEQVSSNGTVELTVERMTEQYWAVWGCAAPAWRMREPAPGMRLAHRAAS